VASDADQSITKAYDGRASPPTPSTADRTSYVIAPTGKIILRVHGDGSPKNTVGNTMAAVEKWKAGAQELKSLLVTAGIAGHVAATLGRRPNGEREMTTSPLCHSMARLTIASPQARNPVFLAAGLVQLHERLERPVPIPSSGISRAVVVDKTIGLPARRAY